MQRIQSAKTVEDAKKLVMKDLNLDEFDSYELEVLEEPSRGFLGIGSKEARVKLVVKTDKVKKALYLVKEMTQLLGFQPEFKETMNEEGKQLVLQFSGDESSNMRSSLGHSLNKLEFLLNNMINRKDRDGYLKTVLEFEGEDREVRRKPRTERKPNSRSKPSRESGQEEGPSKRGGDSRPKRGERPPRNSERGSRPPRPRRQDSRSRENGDSSTHSPNTRPHRERFLVNMARKMAKQVLDTQKTVHLNPMNSYDRRVIHTELNEMENISTSSDGEGDRRHVVIQFKE